MAYKSPPGIPILGQSLKLSPGMLLYKLFTNPVISFFFNISVVDWVGYHESLLRESCQLDKSRKQLSTKTECDYLYGWIEETVTYLKSHQKNGEPQRFSWECRKRRRRLQSGLR